MAPPLATAGLKSTPWPSSVAVNTVICLWPWYDLMSPTMAIHEFKYAPLDLNGSDIRVLRLLPSHGDTIQVSLKTFDIRECPRFTALSYTWGGEHPCHPIDVNLQRFYVRENLWYALRQLLQLKHREQYFWIDAICINQNDDQERAHQVNMMRDIFASADKTIAWLGLSDSNSRLVMNAIRDPSGTSEGRNDEWVIQKAVESIVQRPYFERMWVIQEVFVSRKIQVLCGPQVCWWEDMAKFVLNRAWSYELAIPGNTDALLSQRIDQPGGRRGSAKTSLHTLLYNFHSGKCSDPRDKVYALLGLVTYPQKRGVPLKASYMIARDELYHRTLGYLSDFPELLRDPAYKKKLRLKLRLALRLPSRLDRLFHVVEMMSNNLAPGSMYEIEPVPYDDEQGYLPEESSFPTDGFLDPKYSAILQHVESLCRYDLRRPFPFDEAYHHILDELDVYLKITGDSVKWGRFKAEMRMLLQDWSDHLNPAYPRALQTIASYPSRITEPSLDSEPPRGRSLHRTQSHDSRLRSRTRSHSRSSSYEPATIPRENVARPHFRWRDFSMSRNGPRWLSRPGSHSSTSIRRHDIMPSPPEDVTSHSRWREFPMPVNGPRLRSRPRGDSKSRGGKRHQGSSLLAPAFLGGILLYRSRANLFGSHRRT